MNEENPWKTHTSRIVYQNAWISVREDQVTRPDGKPGIYGVVSGPIATGIVAINDKNEIYLVGQYRYTTESYSWEIPEGGSRSGEDALSAAKRELREETGIVAKDWIELGKPVHTSNCISSETAYLYLARELDFIGAQPDETEILKIKCVPYNLAVEMVHTGEISDAMSIIGVLRAQRYI